MDPALYASVFASFPSGTCVLDREGKILALNPALERLLGWRREDLEGQPVVPFLEQKIRDPAQALSWAVALSRALAQGEQTDLAFPVEFEGADPDQQALSLAGTIVPWQGPQGQPLGALILCWDANREAELTGPRGRFLDVISHELGSPLTNIAAAADRLARHMDPGDVQGWPLLQIVRAEAHRLRRLLGQFLSGGPDGSVPTAPRSRPEARPEGGVVTLAPLLRRVARIFDVRETGQAIRVQVAPDLPFAWGDADRIQEVLSNLVDNALRYAPSGSTVVLSARALTQEIEVCVVDQGQGLAQGQEQQIFEPGVREEGQGQGLGLGLPMARALVQSMGGRIWYERDPVGGGARFCFTLRRVERDET